MKEQIYTIPVIEAFENETSECPLCTLYKKLENEAIQYTVGPSYMEDDIRSKTNEMGFCSHHISSLYVQKNRLGVALMLQTHMEKILKDLEKITNSDSSASSKGFFKKKDTPKVSPVKTYIDSLENSCYICSKVEVTMERYINTFFYLWKKESDFVSKVKSSNGFCTHHFGLLYDQSSDQLGNKDLELFRNVLNDLFFKNMHRVKEDLDWFIQKFDYRFESEPWKNSKDALPRTILKVNNTDV